MASALLFAVTSIASPVPAIEAEASKIVARQSATTCGNNYYSADQVNAAVNQGYNDYENYEQVGNDNYPHTVSIFVLQSVRAVTDSLQYNNYEGFTFPVSGPYQEFPIEEDGVYNGG